MMLIFGAKTLGTDGSVRYLAPGYTPEAGSNRLDVRATAELNLSQLRVQHNRVVPGDDTEIVYTLLLNGAPTALEVVLKASEEDGSDTSHELLIPNGGKLALRATPSAALVDGELQVIATSLIM